LALSHNFSFSIEPYNTELLLKHFVVDQALDLTQSCSLMPHVSSIILSRKIEGRGKLINVNRPSKASGKRCKLPLNSEAFLEKIGQSRYEVTQSG
jgi:hypothetical protein